MIILEWWQWVVNIICFVIVIYFVWRGYSWWSTEGSGPMDSFTGDKGGPFDGPN